MKARTALDHLQFATEVAADIDDGINVAVATLASCLDACRPLVKFLEAFEVYDESAPDQIVFAHVPSRSDERMMQLTLGQLRALRAALEGEEELCPRHIPK